jgi:hypothetical protein
MFCRSLKMANATLPIRAIDLLKTVSYWHQDITLELRGGKEQLVLSEKKYRAYLKKLNETQAALDEAIPPDREANTAELLNALLVLVADTTDQIPKERRFKWTSMLQALQELYEIVDPDLSSEKIDSGVVLGERIRDVIYRAA